MPFKKMSESERVDLVFNNLDRPEYLYVCGLGDTALCLKRLLNFCEGVWEKEVPVLDSNGNAVVLTNETDICIWKPGYYRLEVLNSPGTAFPEDFTYERFGVDFDYVKCHLQELAG